jgi:lysophospholipase L1-like esterase
MSTCLPDPFFVQYCSQRPRPPLVPFAFQKGDRLLLIGDSITEAPRLARMLETYLTVCRPELEVEVRNVGKGGETAEGFLSRLDTEGLNYRPAATTVCYGMNDAGYAKHNGAAAARYRDAGAVIVKRLKAAGARVVLGSLGCISKLPPWEFVRDLGGTLDGLNASLLYIRDQAAALAAAEQLPFVDHFWNLYLACARAAGKYGADYSVCGVDDGVHPSWAGHVVMAYGFFKALGFDGNLGTLTIDLAARTAAASQGHTFVAQAEGTYTFTSHRYPYCAEGPVEKDWSIRSGMRLVPFNQEFNRLILYVKGTTVARYRVVWMNHQNMPEAWHGYPADELAQGIHLADEFQLNPFLVACRRIDGLILQEQMVEIDETWHVWEQTRTPTAAGWAEFEARREALLGAIHRALVPVTHHVRPEALP